MENGIQSWLKTAREANFTDEQISDKLKESGWNNEQIQQLLASGTEQKYYKKETVSVNETQQIKKSNKKKIFILIAIIIAALVVSGGVFAYTKGYITLPFLSKNAETILLKSLDELAKAESGEFGINFSVASEKRSPNAKPIELDSSDNTTELRKKDSQTVSNASQIRTGLILYYDDYQKYPKTLDELADQYISKVPKQGDDSPFGYTVSEDGKSFTITYKCLTGDKKGEQKMDSSGTASQCDSSSNNQSNVFSTEYINELVKIIPSDLNLQGSISIFASQGTKDKENPRGIITLKGLYSSGGTTFNVDLETRLRDKKIYLLIKQFPSLFFLDFTPLKDKWVFWEEGQASNSEFLDTSEISKAIPDKNKTDNFRSELVKILRLALEKKLITPNLNGYETIKGQRTYRIRVTLNLDKLPDFVEAYRADASQRGKDIKKIDEYLTKIQDQKFLKSLNELFKTTTFTIWVDVAGQKPRQFEISSIIVPSNKIEKLKERQFRFTLGLTLDHLGEKPDVDIPKDAISFEEASRILSGKSVEEFQFDEQRQTVDNIRSALNHYQSVNKGYPESLDELLKSPPLNTNSTLKSYYKTYFYDNRTSLPKDIYTNKQFDYTKTDTGYTFTYTIHFPPENNNEDAYDSYSYYEKRYVEGINTANEKYLSVEANEKYNQNINQVKEIETQTIELNQNKDSTAAEKDTDHDGESDFIEHLYGTDYTKTDTDNDGFSDKSEIFNNYDPLSNSLEKVTTNASLLSGPYKFDQGQISFWTKDSNWEKSAYRNFVNYVDSDLKETILIRKEGQYLSFIINNDTSTSWSAKAQFKPNVWHFIVVSWKTNEVPKLYFDGEQLTSYLNNKENQTISASDVANLAEKFSILQGFRLNHNLPETENTTITRLSYAYSPLSINDIQSQYKNSKP